MEPVDLTNSSCIEKNRENKDGESNKEVDKRQRAGLERMKKKAAGQARKKYEPV